MTTIVWTGRRVRHLQEMAGTLGRQPAEPPIASMGSTGPPHVEEPYFIRDRLVSDGAQVTRPSIDPYREPVETYVYLCGGRLRLSMPVVIKLCPNVPADFCKAVVKAAYSMNILAEANISPKPYEDALIVDIGKAGQGNYAAYVSGLKGLRIFEKPVFVKTPPSEDYPWLEEAVEKGAAGVYLDEDMGGEVPLEVGVSTVDVSLRRLGVRNLVSILAGGETVRGSDDVYKLVALGADAAVISKAVEYAVGLPDARVGADLLCERVENLLLGIQREIKLLAGAAGIGNVFNSLVGNREILRAVELEKDIRLKLGVKQAGVG